MTVMDTRANLLAYTAGAMSRGAAMHALRLAWYGDLLVLLNEHRIPRPEVSGVDAQAMDDALRRAFE